MSKTPSSTLNSRIHEKKVEFLSSDDEKLITRALSFVWIKTNKKIEACNFDQEKVRVSYKKNEGRVYFDLDESLSSFTLINKVTTLSTCSFLFWSTFFLYYVSFSGQFCLLHFFLFLDNFVHFSLYFISFFWMILSTPFFFISGQLCPLFPCISFLFLDTTLSTFSYHSCLISGIWIIFYYFYRTIWLNLNVTNLYMNYTKVDANWF